jgi:hypothetical protein
MIERDIRQLDERGSSHALDHLEADIWHGVAARAVQRADVRRMRTLQAGMLGLVFFGSVSVGLSVARPDNRATAAIATGSELFPSTLLLGEQR